MSDPKAKRKAIPKDVLRELFLKSGNLCAFPGCTHLMMNAGGVFIGQICHIEAAEEGGERFNKAMTDEERAAFGNLMLMCYEHHVVTNDVDQYPVAKLQAMKAEQEAKFTDPARAMEEGYARQGGDIVQVGTGNRAVSGPNSGTIHMGDHHYHVPQPREVELNPTPAEIEILTRLADSQAGYLNRIGFDGGCDVLIDNQPLGGMLGGPAVHTQLHEAVTRLLRYGLLTDLNRNDEVYHLSAKGRDAARQLREQIDRGDRPDFRRIEQAMPELLREMREDIVKNPIIREIIVLDRESNCYSGRGNVFCYYRSVHPDLDAKFQVLENNGLVQNITYNRTDRYRINEQFARHLQQQGQTA